MRLPHKQTVDDIDFAVIGLPFDTGATVKVGARFGPEAIRSSSINPKPHNLFLDVSIFEYCQMGKGSPIKGRVKKKNTSP